MRLSFLRNSVNKPIVIAGEERFLPGRIFHLTQNDNKIE